MSRKRPETPDEPSRESEHVGELLTKLEEAEDTVDSHDQRHAIRRTRRLLTRLSSVSRFGIDDLAQQVVGGFILSAPFVVTEEVWLLAAKMSVFQTAITILIVIAIGYGTLYRAEDRNADAERTVGGVPLRFVSVLIIAYTSVVALVAVFNAPATFDASPSTTFTAICIDAIFSVIGAATADSLF